MNTTRTPQTIRPYFGDSATVEELIKADQLVATYRMAGAPNPIVLAARDYYAELATVAEGSFRHDTILGVLTHLALDLRATA